VGEVVGKVVGVVRGTSLTAGATSLRTGRARDKWSRLICGS
jgi:hypothetical protein